MLTGYNTDVACDGVTYHVQTEDKGIANPVILSLVYQGGTILAAKRTNYGEMVSEGTVDEKNLSAMLERQHQIIIAAIRAGKIEQIIKRSAEAAHSAALPTTEQPAAKPEAAPPMPADEAPAEPAPAKPSRRTTGPLVDFNLEQIIASYLPSNETRERLSIELMTSPHFMAGEQVKVRAAVLFPDNRPGDNWVVNVPVVGDGLQPHDLVSP